MEPSSRRRSDEPQHLSSVISELFMRRGYGRVQTELQLQQVWQQIAGAAIAARTKVHRVKNGILHVTVANSSLLQELEGFHKQSLLQRLTSEHSDLRIRDLRFRLQSAPTADTRTQSTAISLDRHAPNDRSVTGVTQLRREHDIG